jgi:hypothetical protein
MQPFVNRRSAIPAAERPARKALEECFQELQKVQCRDLFAGEGSNAILAEYLYMHSFFTQGAIWHLNRFDPRGLEPGKVLAELTIPGFQSVAEPPARHHSSTNRLIGRYRGLKEAS